LTRVSHRREFVGVSSSDDNPPKPLSEKARREAQLAAALRANLRRRKAAPAPARKPRGGED